MAQVNLEVLFNQLDSQMKSALRIAIDEYLPDQDVDPYLVYKAFKRILSKKCDTWVTIPDDYVIKG
jgi:hypothetical protein